MSGDSLPEQQNAEDCLYEDACIYRKGHTFCKDDRQRQNDEPLKKETIIFLLCIARSFICCL